MSVRVVARFPYIDLDGSLNREVERLDPKGFRQRRPDGNGGWIYGLGGVPPIIYRRKEVREARMKGQWISYVEGEKDVHTLVDHGHCATTTPGGAGKFRLEHCEDFRGAKVAIIADADEPGRKHALAVACALERVAAKVRVYEPQAPHKDVTEHLEAGLTLAQLVPFDSAALAKARTKALGEDVDIRVMSMQELMATPDADEHDKLLDHLLLKQSRLIIGAHTGEGKTTIALQILRTVLKGDDFLGWRGIGNGTRALVLDVEQGRRTVKRRFVEAGLHDYPEQVSLVWVPDGLALDSNPKHVARVEEILSGGWDVVIADPLYKLHRGDANDERRAVDLMRLFDDWRTRFGFALVMPMHCRKPQAGMGFTKHDITGSSGYTRGAEVIVGLQQKSKGYAHIHWWKDREGDLGCINERWGLLFDQERGFRRDPKDLEQTPLRERIKAALELTPGMTLDDLREETEAKQATLRKALEDVGAIHDGARLVGERHWSMPTQLPGIGQAV